MNYQQIIQSLRNSISDFAQTEYGVELSNIVVEVPPRIELGDLALPTPFELAKLIKAKTGDKQNPRAIAERLQTSLERLDFITRSEVAGAGYVNVFFNRAKFLLDGFLRVACSKKEKRTVEHTSVNPNKAAHIGHVRNSVLGDTMSRILKLNGYDTEIQNYIDNTGVQVADVVVGFTFLEQRDLASIKSLDQELRIKGLSFDYYCWDLYTRVGKAYETDEELKKKRAETLHLIEEGRNETARLADFVATRNVECIIDTMDRLDIRYDLLPRESEILHLKFWHHAFERMKELGVIRLETEGKNAGCWVMPFDSHEGSDEHDADKILVRSNGTVTYTGKDIAYQLWKLGELGLDFGYRLFHTHSDGKEVWISTDSEQGVTPHPPFGGGAVVYNVIDSRQSYPQDVVKKGVSLIAPNRGEEASVHLSYEMVALSPAAARELGFQLSQEDMKKSFIEMSGRKGLGVKADDLIDRLEEKALLEVIKRNPEQDDSINRSIASQIAVGALRYFLLKFTRNTVVVFDFDEALSFEGETGVYCQYTAVRNNSIFRKVDAKALSEAREVASKKAESAEKFLLENDDIWNLISLAGRLWETLVSAERQLEPAVLAKYTFSLSKAFNLFYHNHKILSETDELKKSVLLLVANESGRSLTKALSALGIRVPERM